MAYTLILNDDSTVTATERQAIVQRSNLADTLKIIAPRMYNEYDMSEFELLMEYLSPISKQVTIETLEPVDTEYKEDYILYKLPLTTSITAENGVVQIHFCFIKADLEEDGSPKSIVREFQGYDLRIVPVESWLTMSDAAVTQLAEQYLAIQQQMKALNELAGTLYASKADDITIDIDDGRLKVTSNGKKIGTGVLLEELNNELVERGAKTTGNVKIQRI